MPTPNAKHRPSTRFQPYEKLLVGWIVGAAWLECQARRDDEDETAAQHPPPTTASPCSQGGTGANGPVTISTTMPSKKGEGGRGETTTPAPTATATAPAPAPAPPMQNRTTTGTRGRRQRPRHQTPLLRATARREEGWCVRVMTGRGGPMNCFC
jgi:hypothetical protein